MRGAVAARPRCWPDAGDAVVRANAAIQQLLLDVIACSPDSPSRRAIDVAAWLLGNLYADEVDSRPVRTAGVALKRHREERHDRYRTRGGARTSGCSRRIPGTELVLATVEGRVVEVCFFRHRAPWRTD